MPQTSLAAPLTVPSPPGRRGERVKRALSEPAFAATPFDDFPSTFPRPPCRERGRIKVGVRGAAPLSLLLQSCWL
jgi:hypothetical protein